MEQKNNVFKRITGVLLHHKETFEEIATEPTSWIYTFLLLLGIFTTFFVILVQVPSGLTSIILVASIFPLYTIFLLFFVVIAIFTALFFVFLLIVYIIGVRLRRTRTEHRSKKSIFNIYIYSLVPLLLLVSQVPFILIFGGYYSLFSLSWFFYFLMGLVMGWHVVLLYRGLQAGSDISPQRAKLISGIYIGSICAIVGFVIYAILYTNFSISWLSFFG